MSTRHRFTMYVYVRSRAVCFSKTERHMPKRSVFRTDMAESALIDPKRSSKASDLCICYGRMQHHGCQAPRALFGQVRENSTPQWYLLARLTNRTERFFFLLVVRCVCRHTLVITLFARFRPHRFSLKVAVKIVRAL